MQNNIYWIAAKAVYPVCNAGAVVIAATPERAKELVNYLHKPKPPQVIGTTDLDEQVIVSNTGDY